MDGRHAIASFIDAQKASQAEFARDVGCSESHLSLFLKGKRGISVPLAKRMSAATDGAVPVTELVSPDVVVEAS